MKKSKKLFLLPLLTLALFNPRTSLAQSQPPLNSVINVVENDILMENEELGLNSNLTEEEKIIVANEIAKTLSNINFENDSIKLNDRYEKNIQLYSSSYSDDNISYIYRTHKGQARNIKRKYDSIASKISLPAAKAYRSGTFIRLVKKGGDWDLKAYLGTNKKYKILGEYKTGEYIGNHHYGFMGRHIGYGLTTLKIGGGIYQIVSGTSDWSFIKSYFDDPRDSIAIEKGYNQYLNFN